MFAAIVAFFAIPMFCAILILVLWCLFNVWFRLILHWLLFIFTLCIFIWCFALFVPWILYLFLWWFFGWSSRVGIFSLGLIFTIPWLFFTWSILKSTINKILRPDLFLVYSLKWWKEYIFFLLPKETSWPFTFISYIFVYWIFFILVIFRPKLYQKLVGELYSLEFSRKQKVIYSICAYISFCIFNLYNLLLIAKCFPFLIDPPV